ncbi:hypothetical protein [Stenotrophomonas sp. TWI377]|uniref:hypothetical protein n=1 Tax=Stenotrophomonas sp. TWI377 TaxID=3136775 RepID=UPI00320919F9
MSLVIVNSIICEDVRREADNKVSLVGVYPRREIALPKGELFPTKLSSLHFYLQLETLEECEVPIKFSARSPSGPPDLYPEIDAGPVRLFTEKENILNLHLKDFPIPEAGKYAVTLRIAETTVPLDFVVKEGQAAV